jgi:hypothetical protein
VTYVRFALFNLVTILQAALVVVLFYRGRKEFPLLFSYVLVRSAAAIALLVDFYLLHGSGYSTLYWLVDISLHGFVFALLVHLIRRALIEPHRYVVATGLACIVVSVFLSMAVPYHPMINRWMTGFSRNLSFCEEVLNLVLWGMLVNNRRVGLRFLLVSAGIGIQVTGEVTAHSLRLFTHSPSFLWAPNLLLYVSPVLAIVVWLYAFCRSSTNEKYAGPLTYATASKAH